MMIYPTGFPKEQLETPALLIDLDRLDANIQRMQAYADAQGVKLRPHTKTHKIPAIAHMQVRAGAGGITVAKLGEAEVMAAAGIEDIFIANTVVGAGKMRRLAALNRHVRLAVGVDHPDQVRMLAAAFQGEPMPLEVMIEVDSGEHRAGVAPGEPTLELALQVLKAPGLRLRGIFTHEGHDYGATSLAELKQIAESSQELMVESAALINIRTGLSPWVSIGSTPSLAAGVLLPGIHELRCGTTVFWDASQVQLQGSPDWCAATVLATVTSLPAPDRAIADAGAKALTKEQRKGNLIATEGFGIIRGHEDLTIAALADEHATIKGPDAGRRFRIGDLIEIIPNHICPAVNLYDVALGLRGGRVETVWPVAARGRSQ